MFGVKADPVLEFTDPGVEMRFSLRARRRAADQPAAAPRATAARSAARLERRGEGFFNVFFQVSDLDAAMERMRAAGVEFVEAEPRDFGPGEHDGRTYDRNRVVWTRPNDLPRAVGEVQEYRWTSPEPASRRRERRRPVQRDPGDRRRGQGPRQAIAQFEAIFGVRPLPIVVADIPGVEMRFTWVHVGDQSINLYQDLGDRGPVARAIKRNGEGLYNVMLEVDDIPAALEPLRAAGVEFVEPEPRVLTNGNHGGRAYDRHRVMWTHPRSLHGMLVEIQDFDWAASVA